MPTDANIAFDKTPTARAAGSGYSGDRSAVSPVVWLYLVTLVTPVEVALGSIALMPMRVLLMIVFVPLMANLFSGKYGKLLAVDILFMLHIAWTIVAIAVNNPNRLIENVGSNVVEFLGGYLLARAHIRTPEQFQKLIIGLLILNAVLLPFSIPETLKGTAIIPKIVTSLGFTSVKQVTYATRMGLHRVQNAFAHPIHYGLFCSVCFSFVLVGLKDRISLFWRIVGTGIVSAGIFLSLSSGALLSGLLQIGLLSWSFIFRNFQRKWLMLLGLFVLMYIAIDMLSNRSPSKVLMSYATFSAQTAYYRSIINDYGMRNVWANPIFGLGLRSWFRPAYMITGSVDDFWLVMAMRYGIPGFLLLAAGYLAGIVKVGLRNFDGDARVSRLRLTWIITFAGLSFTLVTVHVWTAIFSFTFFLFGAGMWMADYSPNAAPQSGDADAAAGNARRLRYSRGGPHVTPPPVEADASPDLAEPVAPATRYSRFATRPESPGSRPLSPTSKPADRPGDGPPGRGRRK